MSDNPYEEQRLKKLQLLREAGIDPYGGDFEHADKVNGTDHVRMLPPDKGHEPVVAGRLVLFRPMGNLTFGTIRDEHGTIQIGIRKKEVSDRVNTIVKCLDLGDIVAAKGVLGTTKTGELTIWVTDLALGAKAVVPPPSKLEGLQDVELRYRNRHVDLWANPDVAAVMASRSEAIAAIRSLMKVLGYMEVETPIMQPQAGGANAKPFTTHHNALGLDLHLRVAPELYLKRLLIGNFSRVFEIGKNFRNEGISPRHNPEFTALEAYEAWGDHGSMMQLAERIIKHAARTIQSEVPWLDKPFRRVAFSELVYEYEKQNGGSVVTDPIGVYEKAIEPTLTEPTFVTHMPHELFPLAKASKRVGYGNIPVAHMFELVINGQEIGCGYTEENDPQAQLEALQKQAGDDAVADADFVEAMRCGMPPAGGLGLGLDRLIALLVGVPSIRDVILFPLQKPVQADF